jgi:hypothetical protein
MPQYELPKPKAKVLEQECAFLVKYIPWMVIQPEYYKYKGDMIKWINSRLRMKRRGTDDVSIAVIMSLITWEVSSLSQFFQDFSLVKDNLNLTSL